MTHDQIKELYDRYREILKLEVEVFGAKPTEVRHLIGRLGEFHCALQVDGDLAQNVNQHGFDVVSRKDNRTISVKTTAQKHGFVPLSKTTAGLAQDLMVIQYEEGELKVIYYGPMKVAFDAAKQPHRSTPNTHELSISRAKQMNTSIAMPTAEGPGRSNHIQDMNA